MTSFENQIRALTEPRNETYPRPWTTDTDPEKAGVLIVGASSAKKFHVDHVGDHNQFIDGLWNRNGRTCRAMYDAATTKPSRTRPNLNRLSKMLVGHGLTSLQTNVSCASARYDAEVSDEDRAHGTELFKVVVSHVPWRAMIIYGVGAVERFGRAFDVSMPPVPLPDAAPVRTKLWGKDVFVSPTLAPPRYRTSVWPYLERVVSTLSNSTPLTEAPVAKVTSEPERRQQTMSPSTPSPSRDTALRDLPEGFADSAANQFVWRRMHQIEAVTGLRVDVSTQQATLIGGLEFSGTTRVFRHKFKTVKPDILLRKDILKFDKTLEEVVSWSEHKNPTFLSVRADDLQLLGGILDAVQAFSIAEAP